MTDSSYDSLDNELDSSSSPGPCSRRRLRAETLQGSLDSILTFSDGEQDADPEVLQNQPDRKPRLTVGPLERHQARRVKTGVSPVLPQTERSDSRERRCSEPAVACVATFGPGLSGREDGDSPELSSQPGHHQNPRGDIRKSWVRPLGLQASPTSSLSSVSPDPTHYPLDSPDSLDSPDVPCWDRKGGLYITGTRLPSAASGPRTSGGQTQHSSCPRGSQLRDPPSWGTLKSCQSLHPNSWLKKDRRLSLTQQEDKSGVSPTKMMMDTQTSCCLTGTLFYKINQ